MREHSSALAIPSSKAEYKTAWMDTIKQDISLISNIETGLPMPLIKITNLEVLSAIKKLKRNKAADEIGIAAEHFIHASHEITPFLLM